MLKFLQNINSDILVLFGTGLLILSAIALLFFLYRRISHLFSNKKSPGVFSSIRNLFLIFLFISVSSLVLMTGLFFRAYTVFTKEKLIAEIWVTPTEKTKQFKLTLTTFNDSLNITTKRYLIKGDQWMIEGDILKWDNWLNFAGFDTRYRLTRLRGRYQNTNEEKVSEATIYSLSDDNENNFWSFLYDWGHKIPMVHSVYGNAVFQNGGGNKKYEIYVTTSGYISKTIDIK